MLQGPSAHLWMGLCAEKLEEAGSCGECTGGLAVPGGLAYSGGLWPNPIMVSWHRSTSAELQVTAVSGLQAASRMCDSCLKAGSCSPPAPLAQVVCRDSPVCVHEWVVLHDHHLGGGLHKHQRRAVRKLLREPQPHRNVVLCALHACPWISAGWLGAAPALSYCC